MPKPDLVNIISGYASCAAKRYAGDGEVDCARAMRAMVEPTRGEVMLEPMAYWWWSCAFKYVWRWWAKGGVSDLDKAIDCLERLKAEIASDEC